MLSFINIITIANSIIISIVHPATWTSPNSQTFHWNKHSFLFIFKEFSLINFKEYFTLFKVLQNKENKIKNAYIKQKWNYKQIKSKMWKRYVIVKKWNFGIYLFWFIIIWNHKDIFKSNQINKMLLFLIFWLDGSSISSVLVSEYRCQCRINFCTTSFLNCRIVSEIREYKFLLKAKAEQAYSVRHAMLPFHVMFFDWHLTAICCIQGLSFTSFNKMIQI